ncbi:MAG: nucleotidyltransferase domain-containing protein [Clostridia bacterium]
MNFDVNSPIDVVPPDIYQKILDKSRKMRSAFSNISKIILFGSYATGTAKTDSDIDLAVFLKSESNFFLDEYRVFVKICKDPVHDFQIQVFNDIELESPCGIVDEIISFGFTIDGQDTLTIG